MKAKYLLCLAVFAAVLGMTACGGAGQAGSVVTVSGTGTVLAKPDMVEINISLSKIAPTTMQAQEEVSAMVRQALQLLKDAGIEDKNISTASLRFNSEYEWSTPRRVLIGQKAEQIITFSATGINGQNENISVSNIIDQLVQINGIELNQMNFGVKNNAELFARSRELAYQKALEKAEQYAALSGLKIKKTLTISEDGIPQLFSPKSNRAVNNQFAATAFDNAETASGSTILPAGEMEITSRITVQFMLD